MANEFSQATIFDLLKILWRELKVLVEESGSLMKLEMQGKMREARKGILSLVIGGILAYMGMWVAIITAVFAIAVFVPLWIAAGLMAVVILGSGAIFLYRGFHILKDFDPTPKRTYQALKEINHVLTRP